MITIIFILFLGIVGAAAYVEFRFHKETLTNDVDAIKSKIEAMGDDIEENVKTDIANLKSKIK